MEKLITKDWEPVTPYASVGGAATGASALVLQGKNYELLRTAIDTDTERIGTSIYLQESLTSSSEVALQEGLELLFRHRGGLCAALHEECCFYTDHSGVIKDSMAKVREGLATRKRERKDSGMV